MRHLIRSSLAAAVLSAAALPALSEPACLPATPSAVRIGVVYKADGSAAGAWAYWWCVTGTTVVYEWRAAPVTSFSTTTMSKLRQYAMGKNPGFVSTPWTLAETDPVLAPMRAAIAAAAAVDPGKPVVPAK